MQEVCKEMDAYINCGQRLIIIFEGFKGMFFWLAVMYDNHHNAEKGRKRREKVRGIASYYPAFALATQNYLHYCQTTLVTGAKKKLFL